METSCPLCRRHVPNASQHWCECGKAVDSRRLATHDQWCAVNGDERRIGTLER